MYTANRVVNSIAASNFAYHGQPLPLSVAIGITAINSGDTAETVLDRADREMYREKAA